MAARALPVCSSVRSLLFLLLVACGDKRRAEPVTPTPGSAVVAPVVTDAAPAEPSRIALRASGKPPVKTTKPVSREQLTKLSQLDITGLAKTVRKLDDEFLDVEYRHEVPRLAVRVAIQPCLRCLPMQVDRWRAEADAVRLTIPPDLRERSDTTFEIDPISIGGAPAIATHHFAFVGKDIPSFDHAVTVYFNDGVNQIRVVASYDGTVVDSHAEMESVVTRRELEQLAVAVLDQLAQAW